MKCRWQRKQISSTSVHHKLWNKSLPAWTGRHVIRNIKKFFVVEIIAKEYTLCMCSVLLCPSFPFHLSRCWLQARRPVLEVVCQCVHYPAVNLLPWCRSSTLMMVSNAKLPACSSDTGQMHCFLLWGHNPLLWADTPQTCWFYTFHISQSKPLSRMHQAAGEM